MPLHHEITKFLFGTAAAGIPQVVQQHPVIADRLSRWLAAYTPVSIGEALAGGLLARHLDRPIPPRFSDFLARCQVETGYLTVPINDDRWGMVKPTPDVYSTSQGVLLASLSSADAIPEGRRQVEAMIGDLPWNTTVSDTLPQYRKFSEMLLQVQLSATLFLLQGGVLSDRVMEAMHRGYELAHDSEFAKKFTTPLFRVVVMQRTGLFPFADRPWPDNEVGVAVSRLAHEGGVVEYLLADKVDERAGSRSRSSRDQLFPWTYSTAYGCLILRLVNAIGSPLAQQCQQVLLNRLQHWPDQEPVMTLKEFVTPLSPSASAHSALAALVAIS